MRTVFAAFVLLLLHAAVPPLGAQNFDSSAQLQFASNATRSHLERYKQFLQANQWDEAVDTLATLLEAPSDELIRQSGRSGDFAQYVPVREHCHLLLTRLKRDAPEALEIYRRRVDPLAKRWLDEGVAERKVVLLRRVVQQMFASRHADQALLALGDLALEEGRYQQARGFWQRITPLAFTPSASSEIDGARPDRSLWLGLKDIDWSGSPDPVRDWLSRPSEQSTRLVFPDSDIPPGEVLARLIIASILEGSRKRAELELKVFRLRRPDAKGTLAGKSGKWTDLLEKLLADSAGWAPRPKRADWPQFAGSLQRTAVAAMEPDPLLRSSWSIPLTTEKAPQEAIADGRERTAESSTGLLSVHPIVLGRKVYVPQKNSVLSLRLGDGEPAFGNAPDATRLMFRHELVDIGPLPNTAYGTPRRTLSSYKNILFARIGASHTSWPEGRVEPLKREQWGAIVALDLNEQGKLLPGFPIYPEDFAWTFDGVPICDGAKVYVAMRRRDPARVQLHVACFETSTGRRLWRTRVASRAPYGDGNAREVSHTLLTLDDGALFVNSNMGAIASLRAADGVLRWVTAYPRAPLRPRDIDKNDRHYFRDLNPSVAFRGVVITAPADSDRVFAVEQSTGRLIWTLPPGVGANATHMLGVSQDRLILHGDAVYWVDAANGRMLCQFPPPGHGGDGFALPNLRGQGRGALAGDNVYIPTTNKILVFRQQPVRDPQGWRPEFARTPIDLTRRGVTGGNLVVAGEMLLIAGADRLTAFSSIAPPPGRDVTAGLQ